MAAVEAAYLNKVLYIPFTGLSVKIPSHYISVGTFAVFSSTMQLNGLSNFVGLASHSIINLSQGVPRPGTPSQHSGYFKSMMVQFYLISKRVRERERKRDGPIGQLKSPFMMCIRNGVIFPLSLTPEKMEIFSQAAVRNLFTMETPCPCAHDLPNLRIYPNNESL